MSGVTNVKQSNQQLNYLIAALQHLLTLPVGAENEPDQQLSQMLGAAINGRSETGLPQPAADRPAQVEINQLQRENAMLIRHMETLACALGACSNCWGTIANCEECSGMGRPGAFEPDRTAFDRFVLPVMTRVMGEHYFDDREGDQQAAKEYPLSL